MSNLAVHYSSASDEWATPQALFDQLNKEFNFTLDAAASSDNHKCPFYYDIANNGLAQSWRNQRVWLNPPYSQLAEWLSKAAEESRDNYALVVMLIPSRTDTRAFHRHVWDATTHRPRTGVEVRFLPGRLKFGASKNSAPFPSAIVIFRPKGFA